MYINEIKGKPLAKPLEITVSKQYIAECKDLEIYGEGDTEAEAIKDFKEALLDIRDDLLSDEGFDNKDEYARKILDYFELKK